MLLGIVLLLGVMYLCDKTGGSRHSRELLVCMITYTLLFSLTVTSFLSMVVTRFIAGIFSGTQEKENVYSHSMKTSGVVMQNLRPF